MVAVRRPGGKDGSAAAARGPKRRTPPCDAAGIRLNWRTARGRGRGAGGWSAMSGLRAYKAAAWWLAGGLCVSIVAGAGGAPAAAAGNPTAATAPAPMPGQQKTITLAESKRPYALLIPPGFRKDAPSPLVVYLHPSEGNMLAAFGRHYWPHLAKLGCVVAAPQSRDAALWPVGSDTYVRNVIADVQARYRTDPNRVVLLGISGGGQAALFLADRTPRRFRAVVAVSANPVVVRAGKAEWFYPDRKVLATCPYFVVAHITHGATLMYWRQVRAKLEGDGASLSIVPVLGKPADYLTPPEALWQWLPTVLAGEHPDPLADPQGAAVAKAFSPTARALYKALPKAAAAEAAGQVTKKGKHFRLTVPLPAAFERSKGEADTDAAGRPLTEVRIEHRKWPIYVRADARRAEKTHMAEVIVAEQQQTRRRGLLYQRYVGGTAAMAGRQWRIKVGSITFPHRRRGWQTTLFVHAAAALDERGQRWVELTVMDETQRPDPDELAVVFRTVAAGLKVAAD
jgi:pimeloyl-ACP methyl ester carboxylesterase